LDRLASFTADGRCHDVSSAAADLAARDLAVGRYLSVLGLRSCLVCPLVLDGTTVGLISLVSSRPEGTWDEETRLLVEASAADLARAVGHAYLYEEQRQLVAELEEADRAKTHWVGNVSHELRTPLTTVRGYVEMLRDGDAGTLPEKALEMLGAMERNAVRLQGLIENLLTLSKVGAGSFHVAKVPVTVGELARSVVADMAPLALGRGVALDFYDEAGGAMVLGDPDALSRVVVNLVSNAIKFSSPGGRVTLALRAEGARLSLAVADTGVGIPAGELAHVGERFFRASNAEAAVVPGTGLGLSIVRAVVEALEGDFTLNSAEGAGTTATVVLPIYAAGLADLSGGAVGPSVPSASAPGRPPRLA
jgi:signal transduction histidine kinase